MGDTVQSTKHKHGNSSLVPGTCVKSQAQWPALEMPALESQAPEVVGHPCVWADLPRYLSGQDLGVHPSLPTLNSLWARGAGNGDS